MKPSRQIILISVIIVFLLTFTLFFLKNFFSKTKEKATPTTIVTSTTTISFPQIPTTSPTEISSFITSSIATISTPLPHTSTETTQKSPGYCLVLEEKYCRQGRFLEIEYAPLKKKIQAIGFNLPKGTIIFAPYDGLVSKLEPSFISSKGKLVILSKELDQNKARVMGVQGFLSYKEGELVKKGRVAFEIISDQPVYENFNLVLGFVIFDNFQIKDDLEMVNLFK